ncbi:nucleoid-associated protein [Sporanaerobacter sp. PP17-6a]|uniref:nucleoid-associated protein n=1 Tax=Sporanaerobacter sp. PP17-6a TaxID=1891289 RepID=UPI0008A08FA8|nr:nucleoid-associated protein [Sporanaerobacter sp. PP17-6a]SCL85269.1 37-kD nucleoid-associated bacterial protein [Sporanaerobacter sp. PP17-6a]
MKIQMNFDIKKIILHILDRNLTIPILSDKEHLLNEDIIDFIEKHIIKILNDSRLRSARFVDDENDVKKLCQSIYDDNENFKRNSSQIATILFDIMIKYESIPAADLIFCLFDLDNILYLSILKFNYRSSYIHHVQIDGNINVNSIIKQKTTLPSVNQKIEECAIINLNNMDIKLLEKKYELNGESVYYFSNLFLKCTSQISSNEKIKLFTKANREFNNKYFKEDYLKYGEVNKAVADSIEKTESIDIERIANNAFKQNSELKEEYIKQIGDIGIKEKTIPVSEKVAKKKFIKQKIKTNTGIEIDLPAQYYGDNSKIEFINNTDGTISILIKNITELSNV